MWLLPISALPPLLILRGNSHGADPLLHILKSAH